MQREAEAIYLGPGITHKPRKTLLTLECRNLNWSVLLKKVNNDNSSKSTEYETHARPTIRLFDVV